MLILTQPSGRRFGLNPDLIQRVDSALDIGLDIGLHVGLDIALESGPAPEPESVVTLVDGTRYPVAESLDELAERMLAHRIAIVGGTSTQPTPLRLVR